ncbi:MAG: ABC transporter permease [Polyangiaceae bacterium]|nr:ABC transporter permease [Polyangiaceae bacterium]
MIRSLRPTVPYDPRAAEPSEAPQGVGDGVAWVGRGGIRASAWLWGVAASLPRSIAAVLAADASARREVRRASVEGVFEVAYKSLPLLLTAGALVGALAALQARMVAPGLDSGRLGQVLVTLVVRELAPLLTAWVVAARSGTAMATSLGLMRQRGEVSALEVLGISPQALLVFPRLVASALGVLVLAIYFGLCALVGSALVASAQSTGALAELMGGLGRCLVWQDLPLFIVKASGMGLLTGLISCFQGLREDADAASLPSHAGNAVVGSLIACGVLDLALTGVFYWLNPAGFR